MRIRIATKLSVMLLVAAGFGVCAASGQAQNAARKKSTSSKSANFSHRSKASKKSRRREPGQKAPTADRISEIQQALAKDGSFTGTPNGEWDASTVEAARKFQAAHALNPPGNLHPKTLHPSSL